MNIVFLDFDGVLAPFKKMGGYKQILQDVVGDMGCLEFEPNAVYQVNKICKDGDAVIVVSSSWRYYINDMEVMRKMLQCQGIFAPLVGMTDSWNNSYNSRREEIAGYMANKPVKSFVILDDTDFNWLELRDNWVKSPAWTGLTDVETEIALKILSKGLTKR